MTHISPLPAPGLPQPLWSSVLKSAPGSHHAFLCLPISRSTMHTGSTHASQTAGFASFSGLTDVPLPDMPHVPCPFIRCLHVVAIANSIALSMEHTCLFQVLFSFPLDTHPEWGSQFLGQFCFKFGGRPPYHSYSGYTNLHSHQQCTRVPFSPNHCPPPQCLLSLFFLMITILLCMWSWFALTC